MAAADSVETAVDSEIYGGGMFRLLITAVICFLIVLTTGCSSNNSPQPALQETKYYSHTIKNSGETLGAISRWYTGTPANWPEILKANPSIKANRLRIGQEIRIPDNLVVKREPFSPEYVAQLTAPAEVKKDETAQMASLNPEQVPGGPASTPPDLSALPGDPSATPPDLSGMPPMKEESPSKKLFSAVMFGDAAQIKELAAAGADVNSRENDRPVIAWASQNESVEVVKALIESGADVNAVDGIGHTALMRAVETNQLAIAQALIQAKAELNTKAPNGDTALMMAVKNNSPEVVKALIDAGANASITNEDGNTPALTAAQNDGVEIIKILGAAKADMNTSNAAYTPLSYAIGQENVTLVKTLLDAGANPNVKPSNGAGPLFQAAHSAEIVALLLAAKANPNVTDDYGQTPLMNAIQNDAIKSVEAFIAGGADLNARDRSGSTALTLAQNTMRTEIAEILKKGGATE